MDYKWVDKKGYVPAEANIQTGNIDGVDLQYYEETYDGETTVTIFGLSDNSYSGKAIIVTIFGYSEKSNNTGRNQRT